MLKVSTKTSKNNTSKRASVVRKIHKRDCAWGGKTPWDTRALTLKYALTAGYNASRRAQGRIWNISGCRQPLIFSKYGLSGTIIVQIWFTQWTWHLPNPKIKQYLELYVELCWCQCGIMNWFTKLLRLLEFIVFNFATTTCMQAPWIVVCTV